MNHAAAGKRLNALRARALRAARIQDIYTLEKCHAERDDLKKQLAAVTAELADPMHNPVEAVSILKAEHDAWKVRAADATAQVEGWKSSFADKDAQCQLAKKACDAAIARAEKAEVALKEIAAAFGWEFVGLTKDGPVGYYKASPGIEGAPQEIIQPASKR